MMDDPIKQGNESLPGDDTSKTSGKKLRNGSKTEDADKRGDAVNTEVNEKIGTVKKSVTLAGDASKTRVVDAVEEKSEGETEGKEKVKNGKGGKSKEKKKKRKKKERKKKKKRDCTIKRRKRAIKPSCVDMFEDSAMDNLYWIVHNAPEVIKFRKFKWKKK